MGSYQERDDLHNNITRILMDNGAAVTKQAVDKIAEYIGERDQAILASVSDEIERIRVICKHQIQEYKRDV